MSALTTRPDAELDDASRAIISQLQADGRRSYAAIGKAVGLSEAAVRQRVAKLLDTDVIQIVAVADPAAVGRHRSAMLGLTVQGPVDPVADRLASFEEIVYVVVTSGGYDILAEAVCVDDAHLLDVVDRLRSLPGVDRAEIFVYLKLHKQTYTWGAP